MTKPEGYVPPLQQPLRQAEQVIGNMVTAPGAEWGIDTNDWVVGVNAVASPEAKANPDVLVSQALGPKPTKQPARYTARTPYGALSWSEGATDLKDLHHADGRLWTDLVLAQRALGSVTSARVVEPGYPKKQRQ